MPATLGALALIGTAALATSPIMANDDAGWAKIDGKRVNLVRERAAIEEFQSFDQRLQNVGWKLVRGNAGFCENVIPSVGLQLQDLVSYGEPEIARAALDLEGDFAVQTTAKGSPAAASVEFSANREVTRIAWGNPNEWEAGEKRHWQRLARAHDLIDLALKERGELEVEFADGGIANLKPVDVCASRFELMGEGQTAVADGNRVVIGIDFFGLSYPEDMFAAVVAHELAHNLLAHTPWLDRNGRGRSNTRKTEREADRLMPWIMANAGYDPAAAARFFAENKPPSGGLLFIPGTHPSWKERARAVEAELPRIAELLRETGKADWRTHFEREIDPDKGL